MYVTFVCTTFELYFCIAYFLWILFRFCSTFVNLWINNLLLPIKEFGNFEPMKSAEFSRWWSALSEHGHDRMQMYRMSGLLNCSVTCNYPNLETQTHCNRESRKTVSSFPGHQENKRHHTLNHQDSYSISMPSRVTHQERMHQALGVSRLPKVRIHYGYWGQCTFFPVYPGNNLVLRKYNK